MHCISPAHVRIINPFLYSRHAMMHAVGGASEIRDSAKSGNVWLNY